MERGAAEGGWASGLWPGCDRTVISAVAARPAVSRASQGRFDRCDLGCL